MGKLIQSSTVGVCFYVPFSVKLLDATPWKVCSGRICVQSMMEQMRLKCHATLYRTSAAKIEIGLSHVFMQVDSCGSFSVPYALLIIGQIIQNSLLWAEVMSAAHGFI